MEVLFISMPGAGEWIIILLIGLLLFGKRLPYLARALGESINEFKKGLYGTLENEEKKEKNIETDKKDEKK